MLIVIAVVVVVLVLAGAVVLGLYRVGLLGSGGSGGGGGGYTSGDYGVVNPPRLRELSPGCLLTIIVVGGIWFVAWGIVLLLALNLLRTPLGDS